MLSTRDLNAVEIFLKTVRKDIELGKVHLVDRKVKYDGQIISTRAALFDLGINKKEVWEYIKNLKPEDCIRISRDYDFKRDNNDDMYEFIIYIGSNKVYIKLTINNRGTVCLSFHKSDR